MLFEYHEEELQDHNGGPFSRKRTGSRPTLGSTKLAPTNGRLWLEMSIAGSLRCKSRHIHRLRTLEGEREDMLSTRDAVEVIVQVKAHWLAHVSRKDRIPGLFYVLRCCWVWYEE
jgi:hypothetical protein